MPAFAWFLEIALVWGVGMHVCVCMRVCVCVHACMRACVHVCPFPDYYLFLTLLKCVTVKQVL